MRIARSGVLCLLLAVHGAALCQERPGSHGAPAKSEQTAPCPESLTWQPQPQEDGSFKKKKVLGIFDDPLMELNQQTRDGYQIELAIRCIAQQLGGIEEKLSALRTLDVTVAGADERSRMLIAELEKIGTKLGELRADTAGCCRNGGASSPDTKQDVLADIRRLIDQQNALLREISDKLDERGPGNPALAVAPAPVTVPAPSEPAASLDKEVKVLPQIDATVDVSKYFMNRRHAADFAIVTIPDPRVPRHRRAYDNTIVSVTQGMLRAGYVLDRFGFPWTEALISGTDNDNRTKLKYVTQEDNGYGLLIFRRDAWRTTDRQWPSTVPLADLQGQTEQIRAVYLVPETGTYGVLYQSLLAAIRKIDEQLRQQPANAAAASGVLAGSESAAASPPPMAIDADSCPQDRSIRIFGPSFSGSMGSLLRAAMSLEDGLRTRELVVEKLCVYASAATSATNDYADATRTVPWRYELGSPRLRYRSGAVDDAEKIRFLIELTSAFNVDAGNVAFVTEGTTFGRFVCELGKTQEREADPRASRAPTHTRLRNFCADARWISVPANIADIRFSVRERRRKAREQLSANLPVLNDHLALLDGAENGSEFPQGQQSPLTSVSNQLELQTALQDLRFREVGSRPQIVVVIATDVRDRLFLFEQIRRVQPHALLIDFEADRLMAHADFVHASRGALLLASAELSLRSGDARWQRPDLAGIQAVGSWQSGGADQLRVDDPDPGFVAAFPTDNQAILAATIRQWSPSAAWPGNPSVRLHVVTREGLLSASEASGAGLRPNWLRGWMLHFGTVFLLATVLTMCLAMSSWSRWRSIIATLIAVDVFCVLATHLPVLPALGIFVVLFCASLFHARLAKRDTSVDSVLELADQWRSESSRPIRILLGVLLGVFIALPFVLEFIRLFQAHSPVTDALRSNLAATPATGLSYPLAMQVLALIGLVSYVYAFAYGSTTRRHLALARGIEETFPALSAVAATYTREQYRWIVLLALAATGWLVAGYLVDIGRLRLTVWGAGADLAAYVALLSITTISVLLFCASTLVLTRLRTWSAGVQASLSPLLWPIGSALPALAATPVAVSSLRRYRIDSPLPLSPRWLFASVLASEVTLYRWGALGAAFSALFAVLFVYLFPVTNADGLLLINLLVLVITGFSFAYSTVRFETDAVLSGLLCNRDKKTQLSMSLFGYLALPFVILVTVVAIAEVPGVLDWGSGIFNLLGNVVKAD